jgi:hypothetical protein
MSRVSTIRRDLVALGAMAPVRAGYEVLKRSGAHGALLAAAARRARPVALRHVPAFRPSAPVPQAVRDRCLEDARLIIHEGHRAFGLRVPITAAMDWASIIDGPGHWPLDRPWWDIDIRTDDRAGDVKWSWEVGRCRDLVVLARAIHCDPSGPWAEELTQRLRWWFDANPPEQGVHWYSNLEIALRVIVWIQIHALAGEKLPADVLESMALHVDLARRHILVDFPYTASSMRNNHLLGDCLGLLAIGVFTGQDASSWTMRTAERYFTAQLTRHMRSDGSMIEDSLSYHRFVLEMLAAKVLLGDRSRSVAEALSGAAHHLEGLGCFRGALPAYGDWDEGRVLAASGDPVSVAGSAALGLTMTGRGQPEWVSEHDEVYWYATDTVANGTSTESRRSAHRGTVHVSGGITAVSRGDWSVWFKTGTGPSHQHADLTHVSIRNGDTWVTVDPGTGTYNGPLAVRNAFRTSGAHNGIRPGGSEMFEPHRAFRWLSSANTAAASAADADSTVVLAAMHDAFGRVGAGRILRAVVVSEEGVTVVDWSESGPSSEITIAIPPDSDGTTILSAHPLRSVIGQEDPMIGWYSPTYGQWEPAPWLVGTVPAGAPSWWQVGEPTPITLTSTTVTVGDVTLRTSFTGYGASVAVAAPERESHLTLTGVPST